MGEVIYHNKALSVVNRWDIFKKIVPVPRSTSAIFLSWVQIRASNENWSFWRKNWFLPKKKTGFGSFSLRFHGNKKFWKIITKIFGFLSSLTFPNFCWLCLVFSSKIQSLIIIKVPLKPSFVVNHNYFNSALLMNDRCVSSKGWTCTNNAHEDLKFSL